MQTPAGDAGQARKGTRVSFLKKLQQRLAEDSAAREAASQPPPPGTTKLEARLGEGPEGGEVATLTIRDQATGRPLRTSRAISPGRLDQKERQKTWRAQLREMTDNGRPLFQLLYNLAEGLPIVHTLPDGRTSEPVVPSPEVMRGSAVDLLHMLHGKPVAQTEVTKAEEDAGRLMQVQAMSDEDLLKVINGEVVEKTEAVVAQSVERRFAIPEAEGSNPSDRSEAAEEEG